jgi:hypothetical protein
VVAILCAAIAATFWRTRNRTDATTLLAEVATLICAMLLFSPVSWDHYFVAMALPMFFTVTRIGRDRIAAIIVFATGCLIVLYQFSNIGRFFGALTGAALMLLGFLLRWMWMQGRVVNSPAALSRGAQASALRADNGAALPSTR